MTPEDFFTLSEMKNGLTTCARVEELIAVMQRPVDSAITSIADAARQWSTVAGTLSATDNNECLHHFVNLNGIYFLNQWLQEAIKCNSDAGDVSIEELIITFLGSLARLPIDNEKSIASGIHMTIECLLGHKSLDIKKKARELFDQWNPLRIDETRCQNMDLGGASLSDNPKPAADENKVDSSHPTFPEGIPSSKAECEDRTLRKGSAANESVQSSHADTPNNLKIPISNHILPVNSLNSTDANAISTDMNSLVSSVVSNSCPDNFPIAEESSICPASSIASTGTCSPVGRERNFDDNSDAPLPKNAGLSTMEGSLCKSSQKEKCNSLSSDLSTPLSAQKPMVELVENSGLKKSSSCILKIQVSQAREHVDCGLLKYINTIKNFKEEAHIPKSAQGLSSEGSIETVVDVLETSCMLKDIVRSEGNSIGHDGTSNLRGIVDEDFKPVDTKLAFKMDGALEMEQLESGEIDALEIARQVARKVEHEVVSYREPYCSSPEISSGEIKTHSPDPLECKKDQLAIREQDVDVLPSGTELIDKVSSHLKDAPKFSDTVSIDLDKDVKDMESLKSTTVDQEPVGQTNNGRIDFDLNAGFSTEEDNYSVNPVHMKSFMLSAPKPVVATSKITSGLSLTPFHYEGELGWKGSAATSAFRSAPSQRTPDSEMTSSDSKQKPNIIEIDLNAAVQEDDEVVNQLSVQHLPLSSCFPSGNSSIEVASRRTEKVNLDLNSTGDVELTLYPSINCRLHQQIAAQRVSPSSSSRLSSRRDFDLNDSPSFFAVGGSQYLNKSPVVNSSETCQSSMPNDCDMMFTSSRMNAEWKSYFDRADQRLLGSCTSAENNMAASLMFPHRMPTHSYGYNGFSVEPTFPNTTLVGGPRSTVYLDSSATTSIPRWLNSAGPHAASSSSSYPMGIIGESSKRDVPGPSQPALDLNSCMTYTESSTQPGSSNQFYQFLEEHSSLSGPGSSGMTLKRKEPDSSSEAYPFGSKQVMSSWL
ncbi:hypothetical protein J5N97_022811 [Dioscorea zingiberensis]|uniref:TFIIS N-terminal domain-containing protein n=1 Tax=Dioscorea zingiberensis TaxID=325984 RepID=A0A9D5HAZ9_9LILI|nr:hypothetical protein J5N97_022811 [Dioscorea zingiberensis]